MAQSKSNWQDMMEDWFMKLPSLPKGGRDALVIIAPWIALIFGIFGILAGLAGLGILSVLSPVMLMVAGYANTGGSLISVALALVASALLLAAFPGTKDHKIQGWTMLFWSEVVSVISSVVSFSLGGVIFGALGFYLLYQMKSSYK